MSDCPPHIEALRLEALRTSVEAWTIRARMPLSRGVERVGPCPICGGKDRFSINARKNAWNCRGCDKGGRDAISLVMHLHGVGFIPALEMITGRQADDVKQEGPSERAKREQQLALDKQKAEREARKREREAEKYRQWARRQGFEVWNRACLPRPGGGLFDVKAYLAKRGIEFTAIAARILHLSGIEQHPYVKRIGGRLRTLHVGPCMIAAIQQPDGRFGAVHQTWLDLDSPDGKAEILHPETGEILPSKIVRGTKKGGAIRLYTPPGATRMVVGEGIETTLSVMASAFEKDTAYWCLVDLGNMAGRAARDRDGKIIHVRPDMDDKDAFVPPDWVREMIFLGDADAKTETQYQKTHAGLIRGCRRAILNRPGLVARIAMAERGKDFNDMVKDRAVEATENA